MNVNGRKLTVMAIVLFLATLFAFCLDLPDDASDYSDAASLPTIDVCRTEDGSSLSGKGAILDSAYLDVVTLSEKDKLVYNVESGSVLVAGDTYLIINGDKRPEFSLSGHMFGKNEFLQKMGLTLELYSSSSCSGRPLYSADFIDGNERIFGDGLRGGVPYYILVKVINGQQFTDAPYLGGIGFSLDVCTTSEYNALYLDDGEGNIISEQLVKNGDRYQFPEVSKEGKSLIGWYTSSEHDVLVRNTDVVNLKGDTTLYAFWWNGGEEHIEYTTLDGSHIDIWVKVNNGVFLDIKAESPGNSVVIDEKNMEVSAVSLEVLLKATLAEDHSVFVDDDAKQAADMYNLVRVWMQSKGLKPTANVCADADGIVAAGIEAMKILSENGLSFESESVEGAKLRLDPAALNELHSYGDSSSVVELINRKALDSDLSDEQTSVKGDALVWVFRILVDGVPVERFAEGRLSLQIPYGPIEGYQVLHVCEFLDNGSLNEIEFGYSSDVIRIDSDHTSVYRVHTTGTDTTPVRLAVIAVGAAVVIGLMMIVEVIRRKH